MANCGLTVGNGTENGFGIGFTVNTATQMAKREARRAARAAGNAWIAAQGPCPGECNSNTSNGTVLRNMALGPPGWTFVVVFLWILPVFIIPLRTRTASVDWISHIICAASKEQADRLIEEFLGRLNG